MMTDCHLHLQDPRFGGNTEEIIATLRGLGISRLIVNGTHPGDWGEVANLARRHPGFLLPSYGLHPWKVEGAPEGWLEELDRLLAESPQAGVGEIGLDRWIRPRDFGKQREVFLAQLALSKRRSRPLSLHCLEAWGVLREILAKESPLRPPLLHSYGGPAEMVEDFSALGCFFSLSGYFFRPGKEKKLAVFERVPPDRLLIETDAPDMAPPPEMIRHPLPADSAPEGTVLNHPGNLPGIYRAWAQRSGCTLESLVERTEQNFSRWFGNLGQLGPMASSTSPSIDSP